VTLMLMLAGVTITLEDARVAATYTGNPATGLTTGFVRGFISETEAQSITLPATLPLVGGQTLSAILPGGMGNGCANRGDDRDTGPDGTTRGWYFYINFTAPRTPYMD